MTKSRRPERFDPHHIKAGQPGWASQRRSDASILNARGSKWTQAQLDRIREFYSAHENKPMRLQDLAQEMGKTKAVISRMARWLGVAKTGRVHPYEVRVQIGEKIKAAFVERGHPRGALGMRHSEQTRARFSERRRALGALGMMFIQRHGVTERQREGVRNATIKRLMSGNPGVYSRSKRGYRQDLGDVFWRSSWEANYARYLNLLKSRGEIANWEFEPETFWFEGIKRGTVSYLPDFRVTRADGSVYYVEVKGWMDAKSKTKLKRMKKYHPSVDLIVVDANAYRKLAKAVGPAIQEWE